MFEILVYNLLIQNADLMVHFLIPKLSQCLFRRNDTILIVFYSINDIVVCYTAFNYIVLKLFLSSSAAIYDIL